MADAQLTRVINAPLNQVRKALQRLDASDGSPTAVWNATKTEAVDTSDDGVITLRLAKSGVNATALTVEITANDPFMSMMLQIAGPQFLEELFTEIEREVAAPEAPGVA